MSVRYVWGGYVLTELKKDFIQKEIMVHAKKKAEMKALSSFGLQYITEVYLPRKFWLDLVRVIYLTVPSINQIPL